jgi:single-strand DNA-binding protein
MNSFKITANIVAEPELKFGNSGKAYVRLRVAESRGENKDSNFYDVTAFEALAENIADSLHKGDRVIVDGYFDTARTYQTAAGETRVALDVIANDVSASMRYATVVVTRNEKNGYTPVTTPQYDEPEEEF